MKKLYIISLALVFSTVLLITAVIPVMAAKPTDNKQPVAWIEIADNNSRAFLDSGIAKSMFTLSVKILADKSIVGTFQLHDFTNGIKAWDVTDPYSDSGKTFWFAEFWYDEETGARMADIAFWAYWDNYPEWPASPLRIVVADYGEPGKQDWYRWWNWNPATNNWSPLFEGKAITITSGNAQIHGNVLNRN
jgi:hypothetical protein